MIKNHHRGYNKGHHRGHLIFWDYNTQKWYYPNGAVSRSNDRVKCAHCGMPPTKEGYDYCLGNIEGAEFACCGHGGRQKRYIKMKNGDIITDF